MEIMINSQNAGNVTEAGKFPCAVCSRVASCISILCQFCRFGVHNRCNGIKFKCQTDVKQEIDIAEHCVGIELKGQYLQAVEKACNLGNKIWAGEDAVDNVITGITRGWSKI